MASCGPGFPPYAPDRTRSTSPHTRAPAKSADRSFVHPNPPCASSTAHNAACHEPQQRGNLEVIDWATGRRRRADARVRCGAWRVTACGCLVLVVVAFGVLAPGARSAPTRPVVSVSRSAVLPGQQVRVAGHGFPARTRVRLVLAGRSLGRLRAGPRGGFRLRVRIPRGLAPGRYRLVARSGGAVARLRLRVLARPPRV